MTRTAVTATKMCHRQINRMIHKMPMSNCPFFFIFSSSKTPKRRTENWTNKKNWNVLCVRRARRFNLTEIEICFHKNTKAKKAHSGPRRKKAPNVGRRDVFCSPFVQLPMIFPRIDSAFFWFCVTLPLLKFQYRIYIFIAHNSIRRNIYLFVFFCSPSLLFTRKKSPDPEECVDPIAFCRQLALAKSVRTIENLKNNHHHHHHRGVESPSVNSQNVWLSSPRRPSQTHRQRRPFSIALQCLHSILRLPWQERRPVASRRQRGRLSTDNDFFSSKTS